MIDTDRIPPQDTNTERSVLGSMMLDRRCTAAAIDAGVTPAIFYVTAHQLICTAILTVFDANKEPDLRTVSEALQRKGLLDVAGSTPYLAELSQDVATGLNVKNWVDILLDRAMRRDLIAKAAQIDSAAYDLTIGPEELPRMAEDAIFTVTTTREQVRPETLKETMPRMRERIKGYRQGVTTGIKTGFKEIDEQTGGLQRGDQIVLAGRPSMGKTALALGMVINIARNGNHCVIFTLETPRDQLTERISCMDARVNMLSLRRNMLSSSQHQHLDERMRELEALPVTIDDTAGATLSQIRSRIMRESRVDVVVVDYLQLMNGPGESREKAVSAISRGLKGIAREFEVPMVSLSQLSRAPAHRKDPRPILSDLRESGAIEQDADLVMFVHRPIYYGIQTFNGKKDGESTQGKAEIIIGKQRNGPTGVLRMAFQENFARFDSLATEREQEQVEMEYWQK